jgi:NAD(P)H-dependent FMN reductase
VEPTRPLSIPVVLGTARKGRLSEHVARVVLERIAQRQGVTTELIDVAARALPVDDAGEAIRDPALSAVLARADALVIVSPEYNHSFPGLLKHLLDGYLEEYIHKAAGIVGVSAGPFGGARGIQNLLPVLRELGLTAIFTDVYVSQAAAAFDAAGQLLDPALVRRTDNFLDELVWMARTLRFGREHIPIDES